jgi:hypothetical protein
MGTPQSWPQRWTGLLDEIKNIKNKIPALSQRSSVHAERELFPLKRCNTYESADHTLM